MNKHTIMMVALPAALLMALPAAARCGDRHSPCGKAKKAAYVAPIERENTDLTPGDAVSLPTGAKAGECFARVPVSAQFETQTEQILLREATQRIEIIPAEFETVTEQVVVKPESHHVIDIPPRFERVEEQVLVSPARQEWQWVNCAAPQADGRCGQQRATKVSMRLCLVDIPAKYETIARMEMVQPPSTRTINEEAQYRTITRQVVKSPAREVRIDVPAEYGSVTKQVLVADATSAWQQIDCRSGEFVAQAPLLTDVQVSALELGH